MATASPRTRWFGALFALALPLLMLNTLDAVAQPVLTVLSPNGGEQFQLTDQIPVRWSAPESRAVRVEYSLDNGRTWSVAADNVDAATGATWFFPGRPTRLGFVRVIDVDDPVARDRSDAPFEVLEPPFISIFSPAGGDVFYRGSTTAISWVATGLRRVHIEYRSGGPASTWQRLASNLPAWQGYFVWAVPTTLTDLAQIRILDAESPLMTETGFFRITDPPAPPVPVKMVRLIQPNGGEVFWTGDTITITWTSANVTSVDLLWSTDGGASWRMIVSQISPTVSVLRWPVPDQPGTGYKVMVQGEGGVVSDPSDRTFEVRRRPNPRITVTLPNGGERFAVDSVFNISWFATDVTGSVDVEASYDAGANWSTIGTAPALAGLLSWTVPDRVTDLALVRVSQGTVSDVSDAVFSIVERGTTMDIRVLSPNDASAVWQEATTATVTWWSTGIASVDIALSTDGGASWGVTLAQSAPAVPGTFSFRVPHYADTNLTSLLIRVSNSDGGTPFDYSDAPFGFRPTIAAAGGEGSTGGLAIDAVAPTPARERAEVTWRCGASGAAELRVVDALGALRLAVPLGSVEPGLHRTHIDLSPLSAGHYRVEVRSGSRRTSAPLVVQ